MNAFKTTLGVLIFLVLVLLFTTMFTVTQGQQGIILRLGRLVKDPQTDAVKVLNPGLHFKTPLSKVCEFSIHASKPWISNRPVL